MKNTVRVLGVCKFWLNFYFFRAKHDTLAIINSNGIVKQKNAPTFCIYTRATKNKIQAKKLSIIFLN